MHRKLITIATACTALVAGVTLLGDDEQLASTQPPAPAASSKVNHKPPCSPKAFWMPKGITKMVMPTKAPPKFLHDIPPIAKPYLNPDTPVFDVSDAWTDYGIVMPKGAYIIYQPDSERLVVGGNAETRNLVECIMDKVMVDYPPKYTMTLQLYQASGKTTQPGGFHQLRQTAKLLDLLQTPAQSVSKTGNYRSYATPFQLSFEAEFVRKSPNDAELELLLGFATSTKEEFKTKKTSTIIFGKPHYQFCYYDKAEDKTYFLATTLHYTPAGLPKLKVR